MEKALKVSLAIIMVLGICSCSIFGEGDPVEPKKGIIGKWQDDADPENILVFKADGTANFAAIAVDTDFKYKFVDDDTIEMNVNGKKIVWDVKTTTRYLWVTDNENATSRLHKME